MPGETEALHNLVAKARLTTDSSYLQIASEVEFGEQLRQLYTQLDATITSLASIPVPLRLRNGLRRSDYYTIRESKFPSGTSIGIEVDYGLDDAKIQSVQYRIDTGINDFYGCSKYSYDIQLQQIDESIIIIPKEGLFSRGPWDYNPIVYIALNKQGNFKTLPDTFLVNDETNVNTATFLSVLEIAKNVIPLFTEGYLEDLSVEGGYLQRLFPQRIKNSLKLRPVKIDQALAKLENMYYKPPFDSDYQWLVK